MFGVVRAAFIFSEEAGELVSGSSREVLPLCRWSVSLGKHGRTSESFKEKHEKPWETHQRSLRISLGGVNCLPFPFLIGLLCFATRCNLVGLLVVNDVGPPTCFTLQKGASPDFPPIRKPRLRISPGKPHRFTRGSHGPKSQRRLTEGPPPTPPPRPLPQSQRQKDKRIRARRAGKAASSSTAKPVWAPRGLKNGAGFDGFHVWRSKKTRTAGS